MYGRFRRSVSGSRTAPVVGVSELVFSGLRNFTWSRGTGAGDAPIENFL
jgi:hypothetical protein